MQTITTMAALDRKLEECAAAAKQSDDAARSAFQGFEMDFSADMPPDPFSDEYRAFQMRLYEGVAGRTYATSNEATDVPLADGVTRPFPYRTGSLVTTGHHLGAIGFLLQTMRLRPGARVLEFGPGWGNTTIALAQLGFDVTAVDVEARFCEVIRRRARHMDLAIRVEHADFFWAETVAEPFDAVVFFECFHHCADHMRLLRALRHAVTPDGQVYFGAEPIIADYRVPWGLRMDGEALWAIRKLGWLELGFRESYFREALHRTGWLGRKKVSADLPWITVWEASRRPEGVLRFDADDARLGTVVGVKSGGLLRIGGGANGCAVFGPHVPLGPGRYRGVAHLAPGSRFRGGFVLDACADRGVTLLARVDLDPGMVERAGHAWVDFTIEGFKDEVEVRLHCDQGAEATVAAVEIVPRSAT